jgi:diguanylate cyclase (GGDEF)-like protein
MEDPAHSSDAPAAPVHSIEELRDVADSVAKAPDVAAALEALAIDLARSLKNPVSIFERTGRGWVLVAQGERRLRVSLSDLHLALSTVPSHPAVSSVDLRTSGEGMWTSLLVEDSGGMPLLILVAGDWRPLGQTLTALAILLSFALRYAREKSQRDYAERILIQGYGIGRRLSRLDDLDTMYERLVDRVSRSLKAERVALALYRSDEDRLAIVATRGYPAATVKDVRIEPGAWVIGHVYLAGRTVLVRDVAQIQHVPQDHRKYRTSSFVAVPMFAGSETIGVLVATDKQDGSAFDERDALALRTFSVPAALAIRAARNREEANGLAYAATVDTLTGLFNRHYLDVRLHEELERARRAGSSVTLLLLDVDDFKTVNDTMGHQVGDAILHIVGGILRSAVRVFDVCARFGGDEFAILMPGSDQARATASAERIRQRVADHSSFPGIPRLTVSTGVAVAQDGEEAENLIRRADRLLYLAKAQGKNRVCSGPEASKVERLSVFRQNNGEPL